MGAAAERADVQKLATRHGAAQVVEVIAHHSAALEEDGAAMFVDAPGRRGIGPALGGKGFRDGEGGK